MDWLKSVDSSWTLFLDRDGVINKRIMNGYVTQISEFHFLEEVPQSISFFSKTFAHVFVVTNQQGIAKKRMLESNLLEIHRYMESEVEKFGGKISASYYAPELASDENSSRKPKPTMALKAQRDFPEIVFEKSIMVGDTDSDILFGINLGMKTVRIKTEEAINVEADLTVDSLKSLKEIWEK
ncbi:MAG: D-glycero-alpha-D-manno-heptose-1,7-bisphosphate 7-phosphatase [Flavobacteriia bacterium]|jgi:D-glycero-D-manno-heptose 1,7-bisphosphate phosphatase